jgi:small subunit ribosomal protein S4
MGDPRKPRKKYTTPFHPWQKLRIEEERVLMREYGLKNKRELWVMNSKLRKFKEQVKRLTSLKGSQAELEKKQLMTRLQSLSLITSEAQEGEILGLSLKDIMERRLQTLVYKKGLARSVKQARQFIIHEHIFIGDKKLKAPGYLVRVSEEALIRFDAKSGLADEEHPERIQVEKKGKAKKVKEDKGPEAEIIPEEELKELEKVIE